MFGFGAVEFKICPREANQVAHELAKDGFQKRSSSTWENEIPGFISPNLVNVMIIL